ncbi:hypothetical protein BJ878DRAFT_530469 [Calycina marina]|uniref:N-acetylglucosamine-induced protein 1 n=1 Tax=Calycina marina TaxID=1763456 RepID=A0A9P8CAT4_9HELO|nr:hypothetical protein BJ878DRAFT_530469 [Calycina marina]
MGRISSPLPYWATNVSPPPTECPPFLKNVNAKDVRNLSTPDEEYKILSWPEMQSIVARNDIGVLQRVPSKLRSYMEFNYTVKQKYGNVSTYILRERLRWGQVVEDLVGGEPWKNPDDVKVLYNDCPYGIDPRIVHLVVWLKFPLASDPESDLLLPETRAAIQTYVDKTFAEFPSENVIWFKNPAILKSVHALEHFHVMIFDPDLKKIDRITGGYDMLSKEI